MGRYHQSFDLEGESGITCDPWYRNCSSISKNIGFYTAKSTFERRDERSWMYQLNPENAETLIERSIAKSGEYNMWYLSSLGVLALSQLKALSRVNPAHVFEVMMKSDILNCQHSMTELMGSSYSQRAALWTLYGNSQMATLTSQLLLHLNISDPIRGGVYHVGKGTCLALCNVATSYSNQGQYNSALEILNHAKDLFDPHVESAHNWMLCEQTVLFERSLHHGKWQETETAVANIDVLDSSEATYRDLRQKD